MTFITDGISLWQTINQIRVLAKKAPPHKDWLDINTMIHDVLALVRSEVQRHGVVVETYLAADVPLILADRIHLQQVLLNVFINAIEAMSGIGDGPRALLVRSSTEASQGILVAVHDSGPSLEPQSLNRLFDAFYTPKPHSLGMGLAISRSIVEKHDGSLWATAPPDKGATFQFTWPTGGGNQHD